MLRVTFLLYKELEKNYYYNSLEMGGFFDILRQVTIEPGSIENGYVY
jgi:hypothetical protein